MRSAALLLDRRAGPDYAGSDSSCGSEALVLCAMAAAVGVQQARSVE